MSAKRWRVAVCGQARSRGVTLLELVAVVVLLGIIAVVATARLGRDSLGNLGAQAEARRVALDLRRARRLSISTGDNHYLAFDTSSGGLVASYELRRRLEGGGDEAVEDPYQFPADVVVAVTSSEAEFAFEGSALAACQVSLAGPHETWVVGVVPVTGLVRVARLP